MMKNVICTFALVLALVIGCGDKSAKRAEVAPLPNMFPSIEALAAAVVQAVADSNEDALYNFVVTKDEYRDVVWANLDSSEYNQLPMDIAWGWNVRDTDKAVMRLLNDYGGQELQLTRVEKAHDVRVLPNIKVHRGNWIYITPRDGQEEVWRTLNVILEYQGWFKVITYND